MYGLVNKAIEQMVVAEYGASTWTAIKQRAEVHVTTFVSMSQYHDGITYGLVSAASDILKLSQDDVLTAFGRYWMLYTAQEGYDELMRMTGDTMLDFLQNLDNMHARISLSYPHLHAPSFQCTDITDRSLRLHYFSDRPGLTPMVRGLLEGVAIMFQTPVTIILESSRQSGNDHDVFAITFLESC